MNKKDIEGLKKTDEYNIGDRVCHAYDYTVGYGTVVGKSTILYIKWDKTGHTEPENGLTIRMAATRIREEKLNQLGI